MAQVGALPNGTFWQFYPSFADLASGRFPVDPAATLLVNFDESTNAALVQKALAYALLKLKQAGTI